MGESETIRCGMRLAVILLLGGRREGDDGESRGQNGHDNDGETMHESSFREGFGVGGGRQVF